MIKSLNKHTPCSGFTLVEMAIVLLILGVILGGLMTAVGQSTENTRRIQVKNKLREIEETLYGFAQVQGRLPCPANSDTNGFEDFNVANLTNGACVINHGLLPNATLGLSGGVDANGFLVDPWGNPYRYSVSNRTTGFANRYTGTTSTQLLFANAITEVAWNNEMVRVCSDNTCAPNTIIVNVAPAIAFSMGKNWGEIGTASADELENGGEGTSIGIYPVTNTYDFVVAGYSEENFDDMLIWISPHLLFSRMITAGKLP